MLARIQVNSYRTAYATLLPAAYLAQFSYEEQDWRDLLVAGTGDVLNVADLAGRQIAGYALGRPGPAEPAPSDGELVALHLAPSLQRQGVGRRLVVAMVAALKGRGCSAIVIWVLAANPARDLYEG